MHTCQPWYLRRHYDDAYDIVYDGAYDTVYDGKPGVRDGTGRGGSFVPLSALPVAFEMVIVYVLDETTSMILEYLSVC